MSTLPPFAIVVPTRGDDAPIVRAAIAAQGLSDPTIEVVGGARGPSAGRNAGARQTDAPVLVFCDDDITFADDGVVRRLLEALDALPDAGAVGAAVALPPDASSFQRQLAAQVPRIVLAASGDIPQPGLPTGACLVVRRAAFEAVGGFDNQFPSGEDVAFCLAVRAAGYGVYVHPSAQVLHYPPASWGALWRKFVWYGRGQQRLARRFPFGGHRRWVRWPPLSWLYVLVRLGLAPLHALVDWRGRRLRPGWRPLRAWASAAAAVGFGLESCRA
jgi:GT2 family glycosyltransferase